MKRKLAAALDFVNNMDARAWRVVWVSLALIAGALAVLAVARLYLGDQIEASVRAWLGGAERSHWGLTATIVAFTVSAFFAAPQFMLIAACVVAFGPERAFWYAWIATIVSGAVTFFFGRWAGASTLKRFAGATGGRMSNFMGRNAFLMSLVVRSLPTAPFIVVNAAMGAAKLPFIPFIAGLALGVLPKTAIVCFTGDVILDALTDNWGSAAVGAVLVIAIWIGTTVIVRRFVRKEDIEAVAPVPEGEADARPPQQS